MLSDHTTDTFEVVNESPDSRSPCVSVTELAKTLDGWTAPPWYEKISPTVSCLSPAPAAGRSRVPSEETLGGSFEIEGCGTTASAAMQVMLTCLGMAALTIPHLFAQVGWLLGTLILTTPSAISCLSMRQIVFLGKAAGGNGMAGAFAPHLGNNIGRVISISLFLLCEFIVASLMAIPCDVFPILSEELLQWHGISENVVGLAILLGAGLAAFAKDLSALDALLKPSFIFVIYLMVAVVGSAFTHDITEIEPFVWKGRSQSFGKRSLDSLSTAVAAFGAECAIMAIFTNTAPKNREPVERWVSKVIDLPMLILLIIYVVFGFAGCAEFGANVESNLLKTMGSETWAIVAKIGLSFVNVFRIPLFNVVQWYTLLELCPGLKKRLGRRNASVWLGLVRPLVLTILNIVSLLLLLCLSDFGKVVGLLGGVLGVPVFTLLPGAAWLSARFYSTTETRLNGSYPKMDVLTVVVMAFMIVFYVANLSLLFE
jgi:amino acid permease